jgi:hypothetical protein
MADNNDGPGKRLKREQAKNTLYVNNPNDPRMFAYKKAIDLYEKQKKVYDSESTKGLSYDELLKTKPSFDMPRGEPEYGYTESGKPIYARKKPKIEVVFKREEIKPLAPRQAPFPQLAQPQMIAPVMRPVSAPQSTPMEEPMMEEEVITERPVGRKLPRAVMPTRQGGWGNQPLLMKLFPKIYER